MKTLKNLLLLAFSTSLIFTSCTIDKRLHTGGYHIHWKHKKNKVSKITTPKENPIAFNTNQTDLNELTINQEEKVTPATSTNNNYRFANANGRKTKVKDTRKSATVQLWQDIGAGFAMYNQMRKNGGELVSPLPVSDSGQKTSGLAIAGFVTGIVGWFMPLGLGMVMCAIAVIFGAISMSKIKNNPGQYKGKGLAIASFIIGLVGFVILLVIAGGA